MGTLRRDQRFSGHHGAGSALVRWQPGAEVGAQLATSHSTTLSTASLGRCRSGQGVEHNPACIGCTETHGGHTRVSQVRGRPRCDIRDQSGCDQRKRTGPQQTPATQQTPAARVGSSTSLPSSLCARCPARLSAATTVRLPRMAPTKDYR